MKKLHFTLMVAIACASCINKDQLDINKIASTTWAPEVGLPLIDARLTPKDLFAKTDSTVFSAPGGIVTLTYRGNRIEFSASDFMDMSLPSDTIIIPVIDGTASHSFNLNLNEEIKKVSYKSGTIKLKVTNVVSAAGNVTVQFLSIMKSGTPISLNTTVGGNEVSADLSGAELNMNPANEIALSVTISGSTPGSASLTLAFEQVVWKQIEGDFKNKKVDVGSDTVAFHVFKNVTAAGDFAVTNPKLNFNIGNGIGVPFLLDFSQFMATDNNYSAYKETFSHTVSTPIAPAGSNGGIAQSKVSFDKSNSQIGNLIKPTPSYVLYKANIISNPSGGPASNFIHSDSKLTFDSELIIPLQGYVNMTLKDTTPVGVVFDYEEIQGVSVRISSINGFPFGAKLNLVLFDGNRQPILLSSGVKASLVSDVNIFKAAAVDANGVVTSPAESRVDISAPKEVLDLFLQTKFIEIEANLQTSDRGKINVVFREDYYMDIKVGVKITGKVKI